MEEVQYVARNMLCLWANSCMFYDGWWYLDIFMLPFVFCVSRIVVLRLCINQNQNQTQNQVLKMLLLWIRDDTFAIGCRAVLGGVTKEF